MPGFSRKLWHLWTPLLLGGAGGSFILIRGLRVWALVFKRAAYDIFVAPGRQFFRIHVNSFVFTIIFGMIL